MGLRLGWWGKHGGLTWGPRGGVRFYGFSRGRRKSATGCLVPLVAGIGTITALIAGVLFL
jgi:hypothetical protein